MNKIYIIGVITSLVIMLPGLGLLGWACAMKVHTFEDIIFSEKLLAYGLGLFIVAVVILSVVIYIDYK